MSPRISIIVPCYNSEITLEETLNSISTQKFEAWEAIIINDGSTDQTESIALKWVAIDSRFRYFYKENAGLGKARNFGIENAKGEFLLPLDSDNLIEYGFVSEAVEILEKKPEIGVVHGNAKCFGLYDDLWQIEEYNFEKVLIKNYIDACAIFRKALWVEAGGYDEKMPYQGFEDWDLWLKFGTLNIQFYHLDKITFYYRVSKNSMLRQYTKDIYRENIAYISMKYAPYYQKQYVKYFNRSFHHQSQPLRAVIFYFKFWIFNKLKFTGIGKKFLNRI